MTIHPAHSERDRGRARIAIGCIAVVVVLLASSAEAKVFAGRKDALREAFPDAIRIDEKTHILDDELTERCESIARSELEHRLVTLYSAYGEAGLLGYAYISVHNVRTKPEALLVVLTADGRVRSVRMLAFHEPLDYLPAGRWYEQFNDRTRDDPLRVGRDVHGVVGATLSARAAASAVRQTLAFYEVLLQGGAAEPSP